MHFLVRVIKISMVDTERDFRRLLARAPMRTVRAASLAGVYTHPGPELAILSRRGVVHRLAHGIYCAVPPEHSGGNWRPTLEAATAAVATALYGERVPVPMATELVRALVTTPEQAVLDLARVDPRAEDLDAQKAIDALWPEYDPGVLEEIAGRQRMRATLERVGANR